MRCPRGNFNKQTTLVDVGEDSVSDVGSTPSTSTKMEWLIPKDESFHFYEGCQDIEREIAALKETKSQKA